MLVTSWQNPVCEGDDGSGLQNHTGWVIWDVQLLQTLLHLETSADSSFCIL